MRPRVFVAVLCLGLLAATRAGAADVLYTFDRDRATGPYADLLGGDGAQNGEWLWDGTPQMDRTTPIFGEQSWRGSDFAAFQVLPPTDLGAEVTFAAHVRNVPPGIHMLFNNYDGTGRAGQFFIAFDPRSQYEHERIFLRFHYWQRFATGVVANELVVPPMADWSQDGKTHQIVVTYDHGTATAYFDGRQVGQVTSKVPELERIDLTGGRLSLCFGGMAGERRYPLLGTADDVLLLGRVLSATELADLYHQGAVGAGLVQPGVVPSAPGPVQAGRTLTEAETRALTHSGPVSVADAAGEWTFEAARRQWKPLLRGVQHVGVPGYEWQTGVLWDGALVFGPFWRLEAEVAPLGNNLLQVSVGYGEPMHFIDRTGTGSPAIRKGLEQGRLPIPFIESRDGDLVWRETVFAHLLDRPPEEGLQPRADDVLVTHAVWKVRNAGFTPRTAHLWLHFGDLSKVSFGLTRCSVAADLAPPLAHALDGALGRMEGKVRYVVPAPEKGRVQRHDQVPPPDGGHVPAAQVVEWTVPLAPGEEAEFRLLLPYGQVEESVARRMLALDSAAELQKVRDFWSRTLHGPGQIITPDPFINDYLAAVAGQMAQQVAYRHHPGIWMYKTSPNHYEMNWPCNAAKALPAFDFRGLTEINRRCLQSFIDLQTDDTLGLAQRGMGQGEQVAGEGYAKVRGFLGNFREWTANPLLLSHGLGMWALAAHYRVTRDRAWLGEGPGSPLQAMLDAFDWVSVQRRRTMRELDGKRVDHWGLLPAASAHDWLAGSTIFNDAFCTYGMAEIVRLLREIEHPRAEEMARELRDYRQCLHDDYAAARDRSRPIPLPDGHWLPYVPRITDELNWSRIDWTYTGYGPLRAGAWGALDPDDPLVDQALAFMEAGVPRGSLPDLAWLDPQAMNVNWRDVADTSAERHWVWRHYVEYETHWPIGGPLFLARDDLPRFFEWLFNNLAGVLHHDFRVGCEQLDGVPSCAPGEGERWQLIRRMFINETGGWDGAEQELFLLQAIPRSWLRPRDRLALHDMGTFFGGRADLEIEVGQDGDSIRVNAKLALAVNPARIHLRLRSGDGRPLRAAEVNGTPVALLPGDAIELTHQPKGEYVIVGRFAGLEGKQNK